jgi:GNAT superfamily N-acetyltransferase
MSGANIRVERADILSPDAQALIGALNDEVRQLYGAPPDIDQYFRLDSEEVAPGTGAFFLAHIADEAVACGAVRRLENGDIEAKRMYVKPAFRRMGVGRMLLEAMEAEARTLGGRRFVLQTGDRQPAALAMYKQAGFSEVPVFEPYEEAPGSVCMAKDLLS